MKFLQQLNQFGTMAFLSLIIVFALFAVIGYYLLKVKKITSTLEKIDYNSFKRVDSMEYVKIDGVVSSDDSSLYDGMGMVPCGNNEFMAAIDIVGYNFRSASAGEQQRTMANFLGFFNNVEQQIQLRQSTKSIDLAHNIAVHEKIQKELAMEISTLELDYDELVSMGENYIDDAEKFEGIAKNIESMKRLMISKKWMFDEVSALLKYMNALSSNSLDSQKVNTLIFRYIYDSSKYTEELTPEEIYLTARNELMLKANNYMNALARCGCKTKLCSAAEILDLLRHHYSPASSDDYTLEELFNSSYTSVFISSDSLVEYEKEKKGEAAWKKEMEDYTRKLLNEQKKGQLELARNERVVLEMAANEVESYYEE